MYRGEKERREGEERERWKENMKNIELQVRPHGGSAPQHWAQSDEVNRFITTMINYNYLPTNMGVGCQVME